MTTIEHFLARYYVFTASMKRTLELPQNIVRTDWNDQTEEELFRQMSRAFIDMTMSPTSDPERIRHHAANMANWSMIFADYWNHPKRIAILDARAAAAKTAAEAGENRNVEKV